MRTLKKGCTGQDVITLCHELNRNNVYIEVDDVFGPMIHQAVCNFQDMKGLNVDGIVGYNTWEALFFSGRQTEMFLTDEDVELMAMLLDCDTASIRAVQEVESACSGFLAEGMPTILFEGHIFWNELKKHGYNPYDYVDGNEDVLYPKWTKQHYKGGMCEYDRLNKAICINKECALMSASWGMFQIMGFNYPVCDEECIIGFVDKMCISECNQLMLFGRFIKNNGMLKALQEHDWAEFARRYNGPAYRENKYDEKLYRAYTKWS